MQEALLARRQGEEALGVAVLDQRHEARVVAFDGRDLDRAEVELVHLGRGRRRLGICYISNGDLANGKKMHLMEIRLVLEERLDHARLVVLSGEVERRVAVSVLHVDVGEDVPDHGHELESIVTNKRMSNSERT